MSAPNARLRVCHLLWFLGLLALAALLIAPRAARADAPDQTFAFQGPHGSAIQAAVWLHGDAARGGDRPLVVISHGNGGWYRGHHDTAEALAHAGFIVAALTHPGDNFEDQSRSTQLTARAPQLSALIDHMLAWQGPVRVDPARIGAFGFSAGGFTVTQAVGGEPEMRAIPAYCVQHPNHFACRLYAMQPVDPASWRPEARDDRIRAAVIAAPALGFAFTPDSLKSVTIPVQLWQAAEDEILPAPFNVEPIRDGLGRTPDYHRVEAAMHFDFLTPCDAQNRLPQPLCASSPGFDRAAFKATFNRDVTRFFVETLGAGAATR
ncbi:MAG: dienelactone hydrolase [Brevundimonas sp.]|nr:MAG: dienelactone hydrolase [Brevundimonas sp.]